MTEAADNTAKIQLIEAADNTATIQLIEAADNKPHNTVDRGCR